MFRNILLGFSIAVLAFLVFISIFPDLVCSCRIDQTILPSLPPNDGSNELVLFNTRGEFDLLSSVRSTAVIDSIAISARGGNQFWRMRIADRIEIPYNESKAIHFQIDSIPLDYILYVNLEIHTQSRSIFYTLNNDNEQEKVRYLESQPKLPLEKKSMPTKKGKLLVRSILGTDMHGQQIWSRLVYGTRIVLLIALISSLVSIVLGVLAGVIRGYINNIFSQMIAILSSFFASISLYLAAILIYIFLDRTLFALIFVFSLIQWVEIQKIVSHKVRSIAKEDFIKASRMFGKSDWAIIREDILPLIIPEVIIGFFFLAKRIIVIEASLSYINFSVEYPNPTWGKLFGEAREFMFKPEALQFVLPPIIAIVATSISLNILEIYFKESFRRKRC